MMRTLPPAAALAAALLLVPAPGRAQDETNSADTGKPEAHILRFLMEDGSALQGEIEEKELTVRTRYGDLRIPVGELVRFTPGLGKKPALREKIAALVDTLATGDMDARDEAEKAILELGLPVREVIRKHLKDEDVERRTRMERIFKVFDERIEEYVSTEDFESIPEPWIREDVVETRAFTMRGSIAADSLEITTRYGRMEIRIEDIVSAREVSREDRTREKRLTLTDQHVAQKRFRYAGIDVERGDEIHVRATGEVSMTPWGGNRTCGPDGSSQYGWYDKSKRIYAGAVVARIGANGEIMKIGARKRFKATRAGRLYFAIGMNPSYINNSYPGEYKVTVTVK